MRALATSRLVVFLARRAGGAEAVVASAFAGSYQPVARRVLAANELEAFLGQMALAGVEVIEASATTPVAALPAPAVATVVPKAPRALPKPVESEWLTFSDLILATQKTRGPNVR